MKGGRAELRAPFPWYGGKSRIAPIVWRAFGDVPNFCEPFFGSGAVLLGRPAIHRRKVETANDKDGLISNFFRATQQDPEAVARYADWPVNEADLHARHQWLVGQTPLLERLIEDPHFFDPKVAGWWVWGICTWIGNGWCSKDERLHRCLPKIATPGHGIHAPSRKKPLTHRNKGMHRDAVQNDLVGLFSLLSDRLKRVRICCGDWTRVLGRSTLGIDTPHGMTPCGVFLDPPYAHDIGREKRLYRQDEPDISPMVRAWALEHGNNPALRIALCGWEGEHEMPGWRCISWRSATSFKNAERERLWLSPNCLEIDAQRDLLTGLDGGLLQ